jgi:hypothetical protein
VVAEWKGSGTNQEFRAAHELALLGIHENNALRFLADARNAEPVLGEDKQWLEEQMVLRDEESTFAVDLDIPLTPVAPRRSGSSSETAKLHGGAGQGQIAGGVNRTRLEREHIAGAE